MKERKAGDKGKCGDRQQTGKQIGKQIDITSFRGTERQIGWEQRLKV